MLGIVSPASAAPHDLVERGITELQRLGYRTRLFPHALVRGPLNYAGSVQDRVADLHAAFADAEVDAIICTRGGWEPRSCSRTSMQGLSGPIRRRCLDYSDITSLHVWLRREAELISFQAPMVASDFSKREGVDAAVGPVH